MNELYLVVDAFDGEANIFASLDAVQAFLKRNLQQFPDLYQIKTDFAEPYLREIAIPSDWKFVDPEKGETQ